MKQFDNDKKTLNASMPAAGFEPAQPKLSDLESDPLTPRANRHFIRSRAIRGIHELESPQIDERVLPVRVSDQRLELVAPTA